MCLQLIVILSTSILYVIAEILNKYIMKTELSSLSFIKYTRTLNSGKCAVGHSYNTR